MDLGELLADRCFNRDFQSQEVFLPVIRETIPDICPFPEPRSGQSRHSVNIDNLAGCSRRLFAPNKAHLISGLWKHRPVLSRRRHSH